MKMSKLRIAAAWMIVCVLGSVASSQAVTATCAPYGRVDPANKQQVTVDPNAIWLENEHLRLALITVAPYAGQVFSLVYKPTGQELCNPMTLQGYWQDRGVPGVITEGKGEIISQSDTQAQVRITYLSTGEEAGKKIALRHTKTYTLKKGASNVQVDWKQENIGTDRIFYNPWIKHVGGLGETFLKGQAKIVMPQGLTKLDWDFAPTLNWVVRLSGEENSETTPMVTSLTDYRRIFRQCAWAVPPRYTLETTLTRVDLKPGEATELPSVLLVTPNLGNVGYAAPELAASLETTGEIKPGQEISLKVNIAAGVDLGEKRLEGQIATATGEQVAKVSNQQVQLQAGKISVVSYAFTPPKDGVYFINLTVFDRQQPIKLGEEIKSQKTYITLPIVVGPAPAVVVQNWQAEDKGFPGRKEREVKPWRTLVNVPALKAGQVLVPERIFPEDKFIYEEKAQPAAIRLAGGEYECLQFVVDVSEKEDPMAVAVTLSSLKNDQGVALDSVQVREQIYLTTEIPSDFADFPVGQWPDPLFETDWVTKIPNAPITKQNVEFIKKSHRRVFWMTVHAQSEAKGGLYKGRIGLTLAGKTVGEFPVEVKVNAFVLPKRAALRCATGMVGWKGSATNNWATLGLPDEEIKEIGKNAMDSYWRLIFEYGWTPTMCFGPATVWEKYKDVGRGASVFPSGGNKKDEEWLIKNSLLKYAFMYAPFDEHTDGKVPDVAEWARTWKATHQTPVLDCYYGGNVEPLFGLVDVWLGQSPLSAWWGKPTPPLGWGDKAVARKQAGDQFFSCNASLVWHVEYIPVQGRSEFWSDFAIGVDGRYVYSTCRWTVDVYKKNWTTGNYMGCLVYPGPHGITTSIRLETLRDAVEDYDYLALLRERVRRIDNSRQMPAGPIEQAKAILEDPKLAEKVNTTITLHEMRNRLADLIEQLDL